MPKRRAPPPSCRSDGRKHDTGLERPYRPRPADFRQTYIEMGWDGIDQHYRTNWRVIRRWIEEEGGDALRKARAEHVRQIYAERRAANSPRKNYVLGRTLRPAGVLPDKTREPQILALHEAGTSVRKIARQLKVSESRVYGVLHENGAHLTAVTDGRRKR